MYTLYKYVYKFKNAKVKNIFQLKFTSFSYHSNMKFSFCENMSLGFNGSEISILENIPFENPKLGIT